MPCTCPVVAIDPCNSARSTLLRPMSPARGGGRGSSTRACEGRPAGRQHLLIASTKTHGEGLSLTPAGARGSASRPIQMLHPLRTIMRMTIEALDGPIGASDDVWLDDRLWVVRYLRVNAQAWLGRVVLVSPISIRAVDRTNRRIDLRLTADQLRNSPETPPLEACTLDYERQYLDYFRYSRYWIGERLWGLGDVPRSLAAPPRAAYRPDPPPQPRAGRLCSLRQVQGMKARAEDGPVGQLDDLLVGCDSWRVRYVSISDERERSERRLLVPIELVAGWDGSTHSVQIGQTAEHVRRGPSLAPEEPLDETCERLVQRHYGRPTPGALSQPRRSGSAQ